MKIKVFCILLYAFLPLCNLKAQSQAVNMLSDALADLVGSFLDNPYHHENTEKVFELTEKFKKTINDIYSQALYSNHPQVEMDIVMLDNMKSILNCLDFMTASITGYSRGGMKAEEFMYTMEQQGFSVSV